MRAATTKIPHLLYEKDLLKTPSTMHDFIYNLWFFTMKVNDGDGRENSETKKEETKEKFPE